MAAKPGVRRTHRLALLHHLLVALLAVPVLLLGPAGEGSGAAEAASGKRAAKVQHALEIARRQKGDPYRYGAEGPKRFDCSGLVYFSTHRAGFGRVPRTSSAQARFMNRIKRATMRRGDFMFVTNKNGVYHVGIFVGRKDGRALMLHAPYSGTRVRVDPVWTKHWFPATLRFR